jgi:DNA-binding PadR family transcriptional regulator
MAKVIYGIKVDKNKFGFQWARRIPTVKLSEDSNDWKAWAAMASGQSAKFFEAGELRLAILSLLDQDPKHGYQLMKEMQERSGGLYRASAGSVYPTLQQLEDEGMIASERENGRRVYRLTPLGRAELERDPDSVRRIWDRAECFEDWGQWGPAAFAISGRLAAMIKSALRAAQWAGSDEERQQQVRDIMRAFCEDLDDLSKPRKEKADR